MSYVWPHLKDTEERGNILFAALKPYLRAQDNFLDVNCGYSPMAKPLLAAGYHVLGFDVNPLPIEHLKQAFPRGEWHVLSDEHAEFKGYSVLLLLGVTTPLYPAYSKTLLTSTKRLLYLNKPRLVLVESADGADQTFYDETLRILEEPGDYTCVRARNYAVELTRGGKRHFSIWRNRWPYPHWQHRFRRAKDEELNDLYAQFLKEAGIKLGPLTVYDAKAHAVIFQPLRKAKDVFLKELILPRGDKKTMLIIAFWDAHFAFNMGFEGFIVDAIECYREAVKVAEQARQTLPRPIADRFMFAYGLAENLETYPTYDVIVSFCLEHVRDPKHVMAETLRHLNPDGCAYFTPPIDHGCDSPTHLQYFQEEDLRELLPEGFMATIHRVKFQASSPYPNCFVMKVRRAC